MAPRLTETVSGEHSSLSLPFLLNLLFKGPDMSSTQACIQTNGAQRMFGYCCPHNISKPEEVKLQLGHLPDQQLE
jgi:hypothetical protein